VSNDSLVEWPVSFDGIVESVVTTEGPNGRWNVAALGLHCDDEESAVRSRTWGRTRTWLNFRERPRGYVQFTTDPVIFVKAALEVYEIETPVLDAAHAWVSVEPIKIAAGTDGGTQWVDWRLKPLESEIRSTTVPTLNRGYGAVVEATVAASRLEVPSYDSETLWERIEYFELVTERCGGAREKEAFERIYEAIDSDQ